jgi:hypothetical protein
MQDAPVCEHNFKPGDGICGDPVCNAAQPARVGRDVATNGRRASAGGVWREEEPVFAGRGVEISRNDPGLNHGEAVGNVDVYDAVHTSKRDDETVVVCGCTANKAGACTANAH